MSRHVWKRKSPRVAVCKYCSAEKRKTGGVRGGKKLEFVVKGKPVKSMPECVNKDEPKPPKPGHIGPVYVVTTTVPLLYDAEDAARKLAFQTTAEFLAVVKAGAIAPPLAGGRWTESDLDTYVETLVTEREERVNAAELAKEAAEAAAKPANGNGSNGNGSKTDDAETLAEAGVIGDN